MEYTFYTNYNTEILKTKCQIHTELTGFQHVVRDFKSEIITDNFRIICKFKSEEDTSGNCYDWYEIDRHYRMIDKTVALREKEEQDRADIDYISLMTGVDLL